MTTPGSPPCRTFIRSIKNWTDADTTEVCFITGLCGLRVSVVKFNPVAVAMVRGSDSRRHCWPMRPTGPALPPLWPGAASPIDRDSRDCTRRSRSRHHWSTDSRCGRPRGISNRLSEASFLANQPSLATEELYFLTDKPLEMAKRMFQELRKTIVAPNAFGVRRGLSSFQHFREQARGYKTAFKATLTYFPVQQAGQMRAR